MTRPIVQRSRLARVGVRRGRPVLRDDEAGFTLLEILVATAVLVVGLVGVLALFPAGISAGREVVEDSTAVNIARSVADAIRSGMKNHLRYRTDTDGTTYTYFVLQHDGVQPAPRNQSRESPRENYFILLPRHRRDRPFNGPNPMALRIRAATESGKTFVYPETDENANGGGGGDPFKADDDKDDPVLVTDVYELGAGLPDRDAEGANVLEDQKTGVLKQYSFAFSIRQSIFDANMDLNQRNFIPGNELYHVRIMVFRAFRQNYSEDGEPLEPVFELDFEVAR